MKLQPVEIDHLFKALADPTRRQVLERLSKKPGSVSELAEPFEMALPSFLEHLKILEGSGLVRSQKNGRVRTYQLVPRQFRMVESWLQHQRGLWEVRLDQFDDYVTKLKDNAHDQ